MSSTTVPQVSGEAFRLVLETVLDLFQRELARNPRSVITDEKAAEIGGMAPALAALRLINQRTGRWFAGEVHFVESPPQEALFSVMRRMDHPNLQDFEPSPEPEDRSNVVAAKRKYNGRTQAYTSVPHKRRRLVEQPEEDATVRAPPISGRYYCFFRGCPRHYGSSKDRLRHTNEHWAGRFRCLNCGEAWTRGDLLGRHLRSTKTCRDYAARFWPELVRADGTITIAGPRFEDAANQWRQHPEDLVCPHKYDPMHDGVVALKAGPSGSPSALESPGDDAVCDSVRFSW
ncbi:hypothetical protein B0H21DRAFT_143126 [Amylocystis lapponica]|nr:hypothetical protein B0H21DRAFT_143126 [Amylocystis lapponica]